MSPTAAPQRSDRRNSGQPRATSGGVLRGNVGASLILLAAFLSFGLSVTLWFTDSREEALFTGLWVPSILALGGFYASLQKRSA